MDSTINFGFVTFLPCLVHLSLVRIRITITMLYSVILPISIPYSGNDFCASDRWSFVESTLLKVKAYVVCICDSKKKEIIIIIVKTSNGVQFSA
jgi:hypothetical protein